MGYDGNNKRLNQPLYLVTPKSGNGNCLKAPGDTSPVLAMNELPGGQSVSTCPTSSSRRRAVQKLEGRGVKCGMEGGFVVGGCSATCITTVTAAGWEYVFSQCLP